MELRQLEAFVAVATELHFGRAAERLHLGQPTVSELVRRLEREVGVQLLDRTTRRVRLTPAGADMLEHCRRVLAEVEAAGAAMTRWQRGETGVIRLGITPPAAPVLAPHLLTVLHREMPGLRVEVHRMWLPALSARVSTGEVDVAITCGQPEPLTAAVRGRELWGEPLLVGLRPGHRLADRETVALKDLEQDVVGRPRDSLFPAWARAHGQALAAACTTPPSVALEDTDLPASRWTEQAEIDWVLLTATLAVAHRGTVVRPVSPRQVVPFTLQWRSGGPRDGAVSRGIAALHAAEPPSGWDALTDGRGGSA